MSIKIKVVVSIVAFVIVTIFLYNQNNEIIITEVEYKNNELPSDFDGYKILQISDLHNKEFGKNNNKLIKSIKDTNPNIIVITGDLLDSRRTNMNKAMTFVKQVINISPVYYIPGNHESRIKTYYDFEKSLIDVGINVLNNNSKIVKIGNEEINLIGMKDISFINSDNEEKEFLQTLNNIKNINKNKFSILLSHRPDLIDIYTEEQIDLVFSGHAHGGQIKLPLLGGLFAPNQGILPKYTSGIYKNKDTTMIVSRGLGNSLFPFRIFNKPEIVVTTLIKGGSK